MLRKGAAAEHMAFLAAVRRCRNPMGNPMFGYYSSARVQQLLLVEGYAEAYRAEGVTAVLCKLTVDAAEQQQRSDDGRSVTCRTAEEEHLGDVAMPPRCFVWVEFIDDETAGGYQTGQACAM